MESSEHYEKYLGLVYRYLGIRSRSEKEIRDYLEKKLARGKSASGGKDASELIEKIIRQLYEYKFLNDEAFARSWIRSRARSRPRGKRLLEIELKQKGIEKDLIKKVLDEESEELPDELTQAKNLIRKRIEKLRDAPRQEIYNKVGAFLARRGYGWDVIKQAIDDSLKNEV